MVAILSRPQCVQKHESTLTQLRTVQAWESLRRYLQTLESKDSYILTPE